ncbi:melanoma inhibitory activity protein 2 isoform X2 [Triplophysa dalaica]|uniref:melanoma inhibitory activity protein 2 isoform X2 n=1 Tax=Triplophysa dalaica TaxID=1582913 RepID=UPI0024DFD9A6|nr:melanoma inhibitory activity protein 2 isoform X2 [Triplophysa dalaica]
MADVHVFILFYVGLGVLHQGLGLISDYKVCGDPDCASMMSRVQAQRDYSAQDCRFLNFRKGDIITVYYKLSGKRSDLWAGSIDKLFGLFPKDAVKVEQRFVDEKKEIQVTTQEFDFLCIDENGSVIDSKSEFDDLEDVTQEPPKAILNGAHDELIHTEERDSGQISVQDVSDQNNPKTTEQGGSSWIGSAVNGLFGRNEQSKVDEPQDDSSDQEPFKSRRIAMDIEENHIDEKTKPGTFSWIRGGLTNAFGDKDSKVDTTDNTEKQNDEKEPSSQPSSSWFSMGMGVLGFGKDDPSKPEAEIIHDNQSNPDQSVDSVENIQKDETNPDHSVENEDRSLEDGKTEEKAQTGWYVYNGITNIYSKEKSEGDEDKDSVSEEEIYKFTQNTEDNRNKDSSSQSIFSVSGFSSVLDNIKIPFQSDAVVKSDVERDNEQTTKDEDRGKKELDEKTDISDLNVDVISQIQSDESLTLEDTNASDAIEEIVDHSQDSSTQNDDTQDRTVSETSETKPTDNLIKDVIQTENNADRLDREMEQNQQGQLQSEEEKTTKQVDAGEKYFLEHNTFPTDLISETQELSYDRMTLQDIRKVNDTSQDDDTQESKDSEVFKTKSEDNSVEDVLQSKNYLTDSNADILKDELKQRLFEGENDSETIKRQENNNEVISTISNSTNPQVSSDLDDFHATETDLDEEKQLSGFEDSDTKSNIETITISQNKHIDSKTIMDTLSGHSDDHTLAVEDTGAEIKDDSIGKLDVTEINETRSKDEDIEKNDEMLPDSGTLETEIRNENKSSTSIVSLDVSENRYALVHNHKLETELPATREENIHSDIEPESHSAQTIDEKMENTNEPLSDLIETDKANIDIRDNILTDESQTNSEGGHQDQVTEELNASTVSESTENDLETKEVNTRLDYKALNSDVSKPDVTEINETRSEDEDMAKNDEMLSDSETLETEIRNENKSSTSIVSLDESENRYALVHNHKLETELPATREENIHSDIEPVSHSAQTIDEKMENTTDLETKEVNTGLDYKALNPDVSKQNDNTQMKNEYLSQEASTKGEPDGELSLTDLNDVRDNLQNEADANIKDVGTEDPASHISSIEAELTKDLFAQNDPKSLQGAEQKEDTEIDLANHMDHQTEAESVTGATQDQTDADMTLYLEAVEESQPGPFHIHTLVSSAEIKPSQKLSEEYPKLYSHLSEHNIKDILDIFGEHKLAWLDSKIGSFSNLDTGRDNEDLAELNDLERLLENHIKTRRHIQNNNGFPDMDSNNEYPELQQLAFLLSTVRETYTPGNTNMKVDGSPGSSQEKCSRGACLSLNENTQIFPQEAENNQMTEGSDIKDIRHSMEVSVPEEKDLFKNIINEGLHVEDFQAFDQDVGMHKDSTDFEIKKTSFQLNHGLFSEEHDKPEALQNAVEQFYQLAVFVGGVTMNGLASVVHKVVSSLPDDIRPGPDLYGLPWEAVVFTVFFGLCTLLMFSCRFIHSIKSRLYASKEKQMAQKVAELLDEKCKVLETFSEVKQKYDKLDSTLQNSGISAQTAENESLELASQKLEQSNTQMKKEIERLQEELSHQNKARKQQEDQLAELEQILGNLEEEAKQRKSQLEQDNTTLKIHEINTERLQKNLQASKEEHEMLLESKAQLVLEAEVWNERLGELEEEMKLCERSHAGMMEDCANKDERIKSLTECLLKMKDWNSEEDTIDGSNNKAGTENGNSSDFHKKQKVQKLIEAAKMSADLKSMEEDKNRVFAKLADEVKAKEDLQGGIKEFEEDKEVMESESAKYSSEIQKLQQKLQIMTEMYQENELKLHRMLTVEEKERLQKEEKLNKAGKKISLAAEELNTYRQRAKDLEEELDRTSQAYKNQVASHEKRAHDNWLAARAADRDLADVKRENSNLRQKLTDSQFKLEILEKDPYVREGRPLLRGERSPYGPSPLGRPSSETRPFLSPPTLMDGPPRLSPQFIMGPGARGHPLADPGLPYRRPPPGPYPMGPLPPRPPHPDSGYFGDKSISGNENRDGPHSMPGDMRMHPDPDSRMGPHPGPPLMRMPPPMDPRDPHIRLRGPYGPPDFFPPRGPGGPPIGMRGPLPPGVFPRAPLPFPQRMGYLPQRPPSDNFPSGPPPRPSPPGSEQPHQQSPSPHDVI